VLFVGKLQKLLKLW